MSLHSKGKAVEINSKKDTIEPSLEEVKEEEEVGGIEEFGMDKLPFHIKGHKVT